MSLTHARLLEALHYDSRTGEFTCRSPRGGTRGVGASAGTTRKDGYRNIRLDGHMVLAHRLAWFYVNGKWPSHHLDHVDGDRSNNRINNLREASPKQNAANVKVHRDNRSGLKGVHRNGRRWRAEIMAGGVRQHLGYFDTQDDAHRAYQAAAAEAFGPFATEGGRSAIEVLRRGVSA